jgi:hypothetical protein
MNKMILSALTLASFLMVSKAKCETINNDLNTENNEIVCQMNDTLATKLFVDSDYTLDGEIGKLSSKILEMPTQNASAFNNKLFQVELVTVIRPRCLGCQDTQTILYKSEGTNDIINKLEVTATDAKLTRNVDANGEPVNPSFVDEGKCELNELP